MIVGYGWVGLSSRVRRALRSSCRQCQFSSEPRDRDEENARRRVGVCGETMVRLHQSTSTSCVVGTMVFLVLLQTTPGDGWVVQPACSAHQQRYSHSRSQAARTTCSTLPSQLRSSALQAHGVGGVDGVGETGDQTSDPGQGGAPRGFGSGGGRRSASGGPNRSRSWCSARVTGARIRARATRRGNFDGWRRTAIGASVQGAAEVDVAMGKAGGGEGGGSKSEEVHAVKVGGAAESTSSSSSGTTSSLDRFLLILGADDTKKLGAWMVFALVLSRLRYFYGVMLGTFVMSYMGNTVIEVGMRKGNKALQRMGERVGWKRLPKKFPRSGYASVYILLLLTVITSLTVVIAPRLTVESQILLQKLSEQDNPYAIIASWMRSNFGEETLTRLEPFLLSVTGDQGRIFAGYPDNSLVTIASKLQNKAAWGEERYARFAKLLQYCLSGYIKKGLNMSSAVVGGLTKVLYKAMLSLLFSFMVIWDLPNLRRGMKALKTSRLSFAYNTISPQVRTFAKLVGQSFEVQFTIAVINTILTTAGLIALGVSGPLVLSFIVFLCSFVPVIGVFISTLPMAVAALGDYGMSKVFQILLMIFGVHAVEAYFLNPQIYASKLKLHPVVVIGTLYVAEHLVGVQGLIIAVPCAVFLINNIILGNTNTNVPGDENGASPPVDPAAAATTTTG